MLSLIEHTSFLFIYFIYLFVCLFGYYCIILSRLFGYLCIIISQIAVFL